MEERILVRAIGKEPGEVVGFYGIQRRRSGEEFYIDSEDHFSKNWMVRVTDHDEPRPEPPRARPSDGRRSAQAAEDEDPVADLDGPIAPSQVAGAKAKASRQYAEDFKSSSAGGGGKKGR